MSNSIKYFLRGIWLVAVFAVLTIIPLYYGVTTALGAYRLQVDGERVPGRVTVSHGASRSNRHIRSPRYTVEYDADHDGVLEKKVFSPDIFGLVKEFGVGEVVTVIQDPTDKENAVLDRGSWTWASAYSVSALYSLFGVVWLMVFVSLVKNGKVFLRVKKL